VRRNALATCVKKCPAEDCNSRVRERPDKVFFSKRHVDEAGAKPRKNASHRPSAAAQSRHETIKPIARGALRQQSLPRANQSGPHFNALPAPPGQGQAAPRYRSFASRRGSEKLRWRLRTGCQPFPSSAGRQCDWASRPRPKRMSKRASRSPHRHQVCASSVMSITEAGGFLAPDRAEARGASHRVANEMGERIAIVCVLRRPNSSCVLARKGPAEKRTGYGEDRPILPRQDGRRAAGRWKKHRAETGFSRGPGFAG